MGVKAQFIDGTRGALFTLLRYPRDRSVGVAVLIVPPFGEEMNKTRAMFTDVAQQLEAQGIAALLPDLYGTGDSAGELRDADWSTWQEDLRVAARWSAVQGWPVVGMLGVRLGCILGAQALRDAAVGLGRAVFWQPVLDGERFMTQLLRLRVAASLMEAGMKETVPQLRQQLRDGVVLEVAGYELSALLAGEIDSARLTPHLGSHLGAIHWMEVVRDGEAQLSAPSLQCVEQ